MNSPILNWGILGLGKIAHSFCEDLKISRNHQIMACASSSRERAEDFGNKFNISKRYERYEDLVNDNNVDIIYIASTHNKHYEHSKLALKSGKHVLCEKPLTLSFNHSHRLTTLAKKHNVFFMEALWTKFHPVHIQVQKIIDHGKIGEVKHINANFAFPYDGPLTGRLLNINKGGGALLDIGIYPLFLVYSILGTPSSIQSKAILHKNTGVDVHTISTLRFPNAIAQTMCSLQVTTDMVARIHGTKGYINIHAPWYKSNSFSLVIDGEETIFKLPLIGLGYSHEIEECRKCINRNEFESSAWSHTDTLEMAKIMDEIRNQIGLIYPEC